MKPLRAPRTPSQTTRPRSTHRLPRFHFGRMDVQSHFRTAQRGCAGTRMRVDLHARSAATASRHAARCPWLGAHWIFAPADRETRL